MHCPPEPLAIIRRLQEAGYDAVLAGGCVRDALLGREPHDWDIATAARPEEVEELFPHTIPVGKAFGILLVLGESGTSYEVATFRGEGSYTDGRHPDQIRFVGMREDVKRRDFTVNALLFDPIAGKLLDFVGGAEDLAQKRLRAVGDPVLRFQEDRLRVLRAIRFASTLGFDIDEATWSALCAAAPAVMTCVSQERLRDEIEKVLFSGESQRAFRLFEESALLPEILPELSAEEGVAQPPQFHPEGDVWQHQLKILGFLDESVRRVAIRDDFSAAERFDAQDRLACATSAELRALCWGTLLHDIGKPATYEEKSDRIHFNGHDVVGAEMAAKTLTRLRNSSETIDSACWLIRRHMEAIQLPNARVARQRRALQEPLFPLLLEVLRLDTLGSFGDLTLHHHLVDAWKAEQARPKPPKPTITGRDLIALGFRTGPELGRFLQECADYELEHPFPDRETALRWLEDRLRKSPEENR